MIHSSYCLLAADSATDSSQDIVPSDALDKSAAVGRSPNRRTGAGSEPKPPNTLGRHLGRHQRAAIAQGAYHHVSSWSRYHIYLVIRRFRGGYTAVTGGEKTSPGWRRQTYLPTSSVSPRAISTALWWCAMPGSPRTVTPRASYGHHCDSPRWGQSEVR